MRARWWLRTLVAVQVLVGAAACTGGPSSPTPGDRSDAGVGRPVCPVRDIGAEPVDGWVFSAFVSESEGLVVRDVRFGPRNVARKLAVPYLRVKGVKVEQNQELGHLTEKPGGGSDLRSTLVGEPTCTHDPSRLTVSATYRVASATARVSFLVEQVYRFDAYAAGTHCEPTKTAKCVRFWPSVTWAIEGAQRFDQKSGGLGLDVVQRFDFDPDDLGGGAANLIRDAPDLPGHPMSVKHLGDGRLKEEGARTAIRGGRTVEWENWHQTGRPEVGLPGSPHFLYFGSGHAGCTECVHAHWSWFGTAKTAGAAQKLVCGNVECWSDGLPQILDGSHQDACIGWVKQSRKEQWADWCARGGDHPWKGDKVAATDRYSMYWQTSTVGRYTPGSGVTIGGRRYEVGDAAWPQLADNWEDGSIKHGGNGSMFVVPARRLQTVAAPRRADEVALTPGRGRKTDQGWSVPVEIRLSSYDDQGPYYLRVHAPGLQILNVAPRYSAANTGEPWVLVPDQAGAQVVTHSSPPGPPVERPGGPTPGPTITATVVFDREPTPADRITYELDAAPNGIDGYDAATGRFAKRSPLSDLADTELRPDGTATCPTPGPEPIPGAPSSVRCRWVAHLNLDGDARPDTLILWRSDTGRGAVAITGADGSTHVLAATPQLEAGSTVPWSAGLDPPETFVGSLDTATPEQILHTTAGRDVLTLTTYVGGRGPAVWILGLDTAGTLAFVADAAAPSEPFIFAGVAGTPDCLTTRTTFTPPLSVSCS